MTDRRRYHDMGGVPETEPVPQAGHVSEPWEKRVDAIKALLSDDKRRLLTTDEMRRGIEDLGAEAYERYSYYERWISSITNIMLQKNVFTVDELGRKMAEIEARQDNKPL
jgi:hypothetical protein